MWALLARFVEWAIKGSVKTAMLGAGLGLASATLSMTYIRSYLNQVQSYGNSMQADSLALLALSGGDIALSMIIGAIITRITISATKLSLVSLKK